MRTDLDDPGRYSAYRGPVSSLSSDIVSHRAAGRGPTLDRNLL
jgi:hypothetical protein